MNQKNGSEDGGAILENATDLFLQSLVTLVNLGNTEIPIILNVGGTVIAGKLVSGRAYFENVEQMFVSNFSPQADKQIIQEWFQPFRDLYNPDSGDAETEPQSLPALIHLKDARFHAPGQPPVPANHGIWWRGRLDSVDGFSFGELSFGSPPV